MRHFSESVGKSLKTEMFVGTEGKFVNDTTKENLLITGGCGFIGSRLLERIVSRNHRIVIFDNLHHGSLDNIQKYIHNRSIEVIPADIRDYDAILEASKGMDVIYHLAAQSNVMGSSHNLDYSFSTNVLGTYNVLKAAKENSVRRVVFASSREVYGEPKILPVAEDHPLNSKNAYGASKITGELYCRVFQQLYGLDTAILRLSNVYGPRDKGRVIPLWLEMARRDENLIVYGGQQKIDFVWIDLVVEALVRASAIDIIGQPVNVGSGKAVDILTLGQRIIDLFNSSSTLDIQPPREEEVTCFEADITRMQQLLNLQPPSDPLFGLEMLIRE